MLAISTGKLVRYLQEDGAHVAADQPYAEIEVCSIQSLFFPGSTVVPLSFDRGLRNEAELPPLCHLIKIA
jgi:hypothetical protein